MLLKKIKSNSSYILFLSSFVAPRVINDFPLLSKDDWKLILNENPLTVIKEFINNGLIEKSSLYDILNKRYNLIELRSLSIQINIQSTGSKKKLIERLIKCADEELLNTILDFELYNCSKKGIEIIHENRKEIENDKSSILKKIKISPERRKETGAFLAGSIFGEIVGSRADDLLTKIFDKYILGNENIEQTQKKPSNRSKKKIGSSLIIPISNPSHFQLKWVFEKIKSQSKQPNEVLIVDDCSLNDNKTLVNSYNFRYLKTNKNISGNRALARQIGAEESIYNILIYCDQDILLGPRTIEGFELYANKFPTKIIRPLTFEFSNWDIQKGYSYCNEIFKQEIFPMEKKAMNRNFTCRIKGDKEFGYSGYNFYSSDILNQLFRMQDWLNLNFKKEYIWKIPFFRLPSNCFCIYFDTLDKLGGWNTDFRGWGFEDIELNYRLDKFGTEFYYSIFPGFFIFHIYHEIDKRKMRKEAMNNYLRFISETGWNKHHCFYDLLPELRKLNQDQFDWKLFWWNLITK